MKTYCKIKEVDIELDSFNCPAVFKAFSHGKLKRSEFIRLLAKTGVAKRSDFEMEYLCGERTKTNQAIQLVCADMTERIRNRDLEIPPIKQFQRRDNVSQKMRTLSKLSPEQQVLEYIAVHALEPLFKAKLLPCQFGSIPGRGQVAGKRKIERLLKRKFHCKTDVIKGDIKHAYESVTKECIMKLLGRDIRKNKPLQWLIGAILDNYPNQCLVIGGYLPTWLFNYVMSYIIRYALSLAQSRRDKRIRMVKSIVCYADDFALFGRFSKLKRAMKLIEKYAKRELGLVVKNAWQIYYLSSYKTERDNKQSRKDGSRIRTDGVDMMGYVVYRTYTIIRGRIFVRIRRQFIRAKRELDELGYIPYWRARAILSYYGWIKNTNSLTFQKNYCVDEIVKASKKSVSYRAKLENKKKEELINERKLRAAA